MSEILTLERASKVLGISERVLADKARKEELPAHKKFGKWYFLQSELVQFIKTGRVKQDKADLSALSSNKDGEMLESIKKPQNALKHTHITNEKNFRVESDDSVLKEIEKRFIKYPETTYTRACKNYPDSVVFMLSSSYKSVLATCNALGMKEALIKKIRKGMKELKMI